ncbi:MAG: DinB family protein [Candidatus Nanopelagicales bacterium]
MVPITAAPERTEPGYDLGERDLLASYLDYHRATLATKCAGLTAEQLVQRSVEPSTLSMLGLVRHLAEVERSWFRFCLDGQPRAPLYYSDANPDGDFDDTAVATAAEDVATWRAECDESRRILATFESLGDFSRGSRGGGRVAVRWVLAHMIEEYARHNGHADLLRQRIDGAVGE